MNQFRSWCNRDEVRFYVTAAVFLAIAIVYALVVWFGHQPTPPDPRLPLFLRLHPERLLAMVAGILGMFKAVEHAREQRPLLGPLSLLLFAGLVQLASVDVALHWLRPFTFRSFIEESLCLAAIPALPATSPWMTIRGSPFCFLPSFCSWRSVRLVSDTTST